MALHHTTPFAICVGEPNPSQQNVACLPLVMKDDMHAAAQHQHHHHHQQQQQQQLQEFERLPKIPLSANGKSAWTDNATECLIDVFEEKWNSLRRGNLKARNWDEVGAELGIRCGVPKTGDQCRHKIEKLRGRFRQEKVISNFGQSKWPWYDRLNLMFGDRARQMKDAEFDHQHHHASNLPAEKVPAEAAFQEQQQLQQLQQEVLHEQGDEKNNGDKGGENDSYASQKRGNSSEREEGEGGGGGGSSPRSKRGSKRRREWSELGAAMKYLGETLMKIEECKMEVQRDNERLRIDLETKRAQLQDIELKRTEMLIQMELKRTEMLCDLELRRTKMQMDLFEALASRNNNARSKKS